MVRRSALAAVRPACSTAQGAPPVSLDDTHDPAQSGAVIQLRRMPAAQVAFDRAELRAILNLYGRKVAEGEWRDYAIDFLRDMAVFSVFRRSSEMPLYRIVKNPALARKQGAYSVVASGGQVLKRGQELERVLSVLDKRLSLVT
jgi:hypothetical protein